MLERIRSLMKFVCIAFVTFAIVLPGCGGGGGGSAPGPITISNTRVVLPAEFSFEGGNVTIQADLVADSGISSVQARITRPDGSQVPTLTMNSSSGNTYSATYSTPMNVRTDGQAQTYSIVVTASDTSSNSSSSGAFTFQVPAVELPTPP